MLESFDIKGELRFKPRLVGINIFTDEESVGHEHMAYRIVIQTTIGDVVICGNHDGGPDLTDDNDICQQIYHD